MRTLLTIALLTLTATAAELYRLPRIKRVDDNLYRSGNVYVQTLYCYHYTNSEDAVLEWDGFRGKVIWANDTTCRVKDVRYKPNY